MMAQHMGFAHKAPWPKEPFPQETFVFIPGFGGYLRKFPCHNYELPRLSDLQRANRIKTRKYFPKAGFGKAQGLKPEIKKGSKLGSKRRPKLYSARKPNGDKLHGKKVLKPRWLTSETIRAPSEWVNPENIRAPWNTTSYLMRAKKSGGLDNLVSPISTPSILATPDFSNAPSYREGIVEEVNKEWGVNGYGSMNGLIRSKASEDMAQGCSSDDNGNSLQQLEQRVDQDFEILYGTETESHQDDQDQRISNLEEENLTLNERVYAMQQEIDLLKRQVAKIGIDKNED